MIQANIATTLDKSHVTTRPLGISSLDTYAYYATAPWTCIALMRLHNLEHGRTSRRPRTANPVSSTAAMFARTALIDLRADNLPIPGVCSADGGDVALIWTIGSKQVEAIFGSDQSGSFVFSDGDVILRDGDIAGHNTGSLSDALEEMMAD